MSTAIAVYNPIEEFETIESLKQAALDEAASVQENQINAVTHAWKCGNYLVQIKKHLPHGEFGNWLKDNWEMDRATAFRYIELTMLKVESMRHLTLITDALKLAKQEAKPKIRQQVLEYVRNNPGCTDDEIAESIDEKPASVRGRRSELCSEGLIQKIGSRSVSRKKPISIYSAVSESEIVLKKEEVEDAVATMSFVDALRAATRCNSVNADYLSNKTGIAKAKVQAWLELSEEAASYKAVKRQDETFAIHKQRIKSDKQFTNEVKSQSIHGDSTPLEHLASDLDTVSNKIEGILRTFGPECKDFKVFDQLNERDKQNFKVLFTNLMSKVSVTFPTFIEWISK
jgi:predicted transcriptional regulator